MMSSHTFCALTLAAALLMLSACGGSNADNNATTTPEPEPDLYPALEAADPIALADVSLGIGVHHGEALALQVNKPENLGFTRDTFTHGMYQVQSYDELTHQFGEYTYFRISDAENPRSAVEFIQTPRLGELAPRTTDLYEEVDTAFSRAGVDPFESESVTIDFWRTNRQWYVRWDGLIGEDVNTVGIGPYGFGREDMVDDLLAEIEAVAREHKPKYIVIGSEMERLWATDMMEAGVAIGEWSGFLSFYQDAIARIKDASPDTKVGVGINWDRFVSDVVPAYIALETAEMEPGDEPIARAEQIDRAFRAIILPTLEWGDALTLMSYTTPADEEALANYQWLRRLPDLYNIDPPVVYYSVASPVDNAAANQAQRNYMKNFLEWNAGVNVESIYWERMINVDGSNGSNQMISGRCKAMVEDETKNFAFPRERCFDGLFDTVFQQKPIITGFKTDFK